MRIIFAVVCILLASQAVATEDHKPFKKVDWSFEGVFGHMHHSIFLHPA